MRKINFAFVDNNDIQRKTACEMFSDYLNKTNMRYQIESFNSGGELLYEVEKGGGFDVYVMETLMPDIHGIRLAEKLRDRGDEGIIIFLTSDQNSAYQAFKVRATDYILKPLSKESIIKVISNVYSEINRKQCSPTVQIKFKTGLKRVSIDNIKYIDIVDRALCFHMKNGENLVTKCLRGSFKDEVRNSIGMAVDLTEFTFAGTVCFLNIGYIEKIDGEEVLLKTGEQVQVPRTAIAKIYAAWQGYWI